MTDPILSDSALKAARFALDGLARRQEVIGQNLANIDTPGYKAQTVDFETALKRSLEKGTSMRPQKTHPGHRIASQAEPGRVQIELRRGGSQRADGNTVDLDTELLEMSETGLRFQALTTLVSKKLSLLKTIAQNQGY
ncbi:MAG: flagellar basal body rod protein FlgB [Chloroflexi bacterium]|jgi:flagellar basal-body rod protein FlgB|nr:flagellar basal body rod protein FlgB [Chloroflexota bacterium]